MSFAPEAIEEAIRRAVPRGLGFGGRCAAFAVALNRALGGGGTYLCADGQHYEFVEHVALLFEGEVYDASGRIGLDGLKDYADPEDGEEPEIIEIADDSVLSMVDPTGGGLAGPLDADLTETRLRRALPSAFPAP